MKITPSFPSLLLVNSYAISPPTTRTRAYACCRIRTCSEGALSAACAAAARFPIRAGAEPGIEPDPTDENWVSEGANRDAVTVGGRGAVMLLDSFRVAVAWIVGTTSREVDEPRCATVGEVREAGEGGASRTAE